MRQKPLESFAIQLHGMFPVWRKKAYYKWFALSVIELLAIWQSIIVLTLDNGNVKFRNNCHYSKTSDFYL